MESQESQLPPVPRFGWSSFDKRLFRIRSVLQRYLDVDIRGDVYAELVASVSSTFSSKTPPPNTIELMLGPYAGYVFTKKDMQVLSHRVAGGHDLLLRGIVPHHESIQNYEGWVPTVVMSSFPEKRNDRYGVGLRFRLLSGHLAGVIVSRWWSSRQAAYLANYSDDENPGFGFRYFRRNKLGEVTGGLPYADALQFFGLRCYLYVTHASDDGWEGTVVRNSASTKAYNVRLLKARERMLSPCVMDADFTKPCWQCDWRMPDCPNATRGEV